MCARHWYLIALWLGCTSCAHGADGDTDTPSTAAGAAASNAPASAIASPGTAASAGLPDVPAPPASPGLEPESALPPGGATSIPLAAGECVSTGAIEASLRPANVLFLVDRSASLNCNLPPLTQSADCETAPERRDAAAPSKWEIVRAALQEALANLPESASAGITYFSNDDRCGVQSEPQVPLARLDGAQRKRLADSLAAVQPRGGTPLVGGLILAYKRLNPDQSPGLPHGNRFVVLLTDGEEGCAPEEVENLLQRELPKSRTARITTFVVGVPGSEVNRGFLSQLAFAGGAPRAPQCVHDGGDPSVGDCHFDMTREDDLASALGRSLSSIAERALGCEFDVPDPPGAAPLDYERVNVVYTDVDGVDHVVGKDDERACDSGADGWQYNEDRSKVALCGTACERVRAAAAIRIALGCRSLRVD